METIGHKNSCFTCGIEQKRIDGHHLSYEPEIIVYLCYKCHLLLHAMHRVQKMPKDRYDLFLNWIKKYGHVWENGTEKYHKSQFWKDAHKERNKKWDSKHPDIIRAREKRYRERHPDQIKANYKKWYDTYRRVKNDGTVIGRISQ